MSQVGTAGTILTYNGVNFGPYTDTTGFSIKPVMDASGRITSHNEYSIRFRTVVTGPSVGATMASFRSALTKNGGVLIMTGRPCGDVFVNTRNIRDVRNGPIVNELSFQFHGTRSAHLDWSISFAVPECVDAKYQGVREFTYTVQFEVDELGYSKRVITGVLRVAQNLSAPGGKFSQASADDYWERVQPTLVPGFRRTFGPRTLSEDRSELQFSIIDEELRGPAPPPGVAKHSGSVSLSSGSGAGVQWAGTITYSATVSKGGSVDDAIRGWQQFIQWRFLKMKQIANQGKNGSVDLFPSSCEIREGDISDANSVDISVQFTLISSIDQILQRSGMWTVAPGHGNWRRWAQSLADNAFNPRGWAGLRFDVTQDRIISLCDGVQPTLPDTRTPIEHEVRGRNIIDVFPPVDPENSWIMFENAIWKEEDSGVVGTRLLPTSPLTSRTDRGGDVNAAELRGGVIPPGVTGGGGYGGGVGNNVVPGLGGGGRLEPEFLSDGKNSATRTARPQTVIFMKGRAARARFQCWQPTLETILGVPVVPANRADMGEGFTQKAVWNNGRDVVFKSEWKLRYLVDGDLPSGDLPPAPNPLLDNKR